MNEISTLFYRYTDAWEKNIRGPQIGCYSVAIIGLTIALRKVRPFSKFKKPSSIPNHFINERRQLSGFVNRIDPAGGILMVKHKPLINLPFSRDGELPVKISGVKVTGLGINWLQAIVAENEVHFIPILKQDKFVQCEVILPQVTKDNKITVVNVGETLLKIGFGQIETIEKPLSGTTNYLKYYNRLKSAEDYAQRKQMGYRYYVKSTINVLQLASMKVNALILASTKKVPTLYKIYSS